MFLPTSPYTPEHKGKVESGIKYMKHKPLADSLDVRLQEATASWLSHAEFLELIRQDKLAVRGARLIERRMRAACFRDQKTLEDFDGDFNRTPFPAHSARRSSAPVPPVPRSSGC